MIAPMLALLTAMSRARRSIAAGGALALLCFATAAAQPGPSQKALLESYVATAKAANPGFTEFSAERGRAFFHGKHTGGKPELASCTSCHFDDPKKPGRTRAGKEIAPMAFSVNPKRFSDPPEVEKWFKRNCTDVLGRECTITEKGDVLVYLLGI